MSCHAEFLRVALGDETLSRSVLRTPHALEASSPRLRALAELTIAVTTAPHTLSVALRDRTRVAGLTDEDVLHAILLSSFFGHLNRIADAVAVPLDYEVLLQPPPIDRDMPGFQPAPHPLVGRSAIDVSLRPSTAHQLAAWRKYAFERDAPLSRRQRTLLARWVARWLGDGTISSPDDLTANPLDQALRELAEMITLAPWRLSELSFEALRRMGLDDHALFDVCATATAAGMFSRVEVALTALER